MFGALEATRGAVGAEVDTVGDGIGTAPEVVSTAGGRSAKMTRTISAARNTVAAIANNRNRRFSLIEELPMLGQSKNSQPFLRCSLRTGVIDGWGDK
ncbi:hypothetical protein GCM10009563_23600 [Subtercola frigoramans]